MWKFSLILLIACDAGAKQLAESTSELKNVDAGLDAAPACWIYRASHCETTNHAIEQICVPYDGCGCYKCEPGNNGKGHAYGHGSFCYCGPGTLAQ